LTKKKIGLLDGINDEGVLKSILKNTGKNLKEVPEKKGRYP
jgi:hypothetical protein